MGTQIKVTRQHGMDLATAKARLEKMVPILSQQYGLTAVACDGGFEFKGKGISGGKVVLTDDSVAVEVDLGVGAGFFKGQIEAGISQMLQTHFA